MRWNAWQRQPPKSIERRSQLRQGSEQGRLWAQGTARVGEHYRVRRIPVIKKQAISAYDPRVIEATGVAMMATAQGADHTAGNLPRLKTRDMNIDQIIEQSLAHQARVAANDSLGLCIFGMSVTNPNTEFLANALNAAHGTTLTKDFFEPLGREALRLFLADAPHFVLLDIMMPGANGYDVCRETRARDPDVPIIFISAMLSLGLRSISSTTSRSGTRSTSS